MGNNISPPSTFDIVKSSMIPQNAHAPTTHVQDQVKKHIDEVCKINPNNEICDIFDSGKKEEQKK